MDNTSLEDFLDDSRDSEDTVSEESNSGPPISRWSPDGTACAVCSNLATRLWHQDGRLVCRSCKAWE